MPANELALKSARDLKAALPARVLKRPQQGRSRAKKASQPISQAHELYVREIASMYPYAEKKPESGLHAGALLQGH
jgi:hypothetical protein